MPNKCHVCSMDGSRKNCVKKHRLLDIYICTSCNKQEEYLTITPTATKIEFKLKETELKDLKSVVVYNPIYRGNMTLYMKKDVIEVALEKMRKISDEQNEILEERNKQLIKYKIKKENIHPEFWDFIIGDYLDKTIKKPKTGITNIVRMANASIKLVNSNQPKRKNLINHFILYKKMNPKEITYNALISSSTKLEIFKEQCFNISAYLTNNDREQWIKSYNAEYSEILSNLTPFKLYKKIMKIMIDKFSNIDKFKIANLIEVTYKDDLEITYKYCFHSEYGIDNTIIKLRNLIANKSKPEFHKLRKDELKKKMSDYNLEVQDSSLQCTSYIHGETLLSLDEIVTLMRANDWLNKHFDVFSYSKYNDAIILKIKNLVFEKLYSWDDAYIKVISNGNLLRYLGRYD